MPPSEKNNSATLLPSGKELKTQTAQALTAYPTPPSGRYLPGTTGRGGADRHDFDILSREDEARRVHWSVPWSDLMMTMFILFAVMYAFHASNSGSTTQDAQSADSEQPTIQKVYDLSQAALQTKNTPAMLSVDLVKNRAVRIVLTGDLLFDSGSVELSSQGRDILTELAAVLGTTSYPVHVIGHTDDQPVATLAHPSNWELSAARAGRVARYLTLDMGLVPSRFTISGRGAQQPLLPNTTDENRARNRRVEIVLTRDRLPAWPMYPGTSGLPPVVRKMTPPDRGGKTG